MAQELILFWQRLQRGCGAEAVFSALFLLFSPDFLFFPHGFIFLLMEI